MKPFAFPRRVGRGPSIILLVGVTAIIAMAVFSYRTIDREFTQSALSRRAALSYLAASLLTEKFDRLVDIGVSLASRVRFRALIDAGNWKEAVGILGGVPADFPFIDRIALVDLSGNLVADVPVDATVYGQNFAHRDWYRAVMQTGHPYISRVYMRAAQPRTNVFVAAVPIKNDKSEMRGILILQVRSDRFFNWTKEVDVGPRGLLYIVDREARVASHPKFQAQDDLIDYSGVPLVQRMMRGMRGVEHVFDATGKEELVVAYEPVDRYRWGVALEQPAEVVFAARDDQLKQILFAYGVIFLLIFLCAELAARSMEERERSQAALAGQATILQSIMDSMGDGVVVTDKRMRVLLMNPVARRIIGLTPGDPPPENWAAMEGLFLPDMVTPFPRERLFMSRALLGEYVDDEELFIRNHRFPDGLWLSGSARPIKIGGAAEQAVVVWRDVTERRRAESEIKSLNKELAQHAAKLESTNKDLESFSYSVSHDLRSPLRAIDGYSRMLEEECGDKLDDEGRRLLDVVRGNCRRMGTLIDDLLAFSRLGRQAVNAETVDMNALFDEAAREVRAGDADSKPANIVRTDLPPAWGDRALLKQVWVNLLSNALKFSSGSDRPVIEVSGYCKGAKNIYQVSDHGAGFDMQYYSKLFGVFQRLHSTREFPGTGVGLAIVHRVISRHDGRVWADGKVNEGANFYFALPAGRSTENESTQSA